MDYESKKSIAVIIGGTLLFCSIFIYGIILMIKKYKTLNQSSSQPQIKTTVQPTTTTASTIPTTSPTTTTLPSTSSSITPIITTTLPTTSPTTSQTTSSSLTPIITTSPKTSTTSPTTSTTTSTTPSTTTSTTPSSTITSTTPSTITTSTPTIQNTSMSNTFLMGSSSSSWVSNTSLSVTPVYYSSSSSALSTQIPTTSINLQITSQNKSSSRSSSITSLPINNSTNPLLFWFDPTDASTIKSDIIKSKIDYIVNYRDDKGKDHTQTLIASLYPSNLTDTIIDLKIVSMNNINMININNNDLENIPNGLEFLSLYKIFSTTGLTIFIVYFMSQVYDYTSFITTENYNNNYPIKMYNNQRILNGVTKQSKITIGKSDDNKYITLYTVSINVSSGTGQWYETIYNNHNTSITDTIIFPNVTYFKQDNISNRIAFGGPLSTYINGAFSGNIGEILVYNNFLDPINSSSSSLYNQNVSYLKNKWNI